MVRVSLRLSRESQCLPLASAGRGQYEGAGRQEQEEERGWVRAVRRPPRGAPPSRRSPQRNCQNLGAGAAAATAAAAAASPGGGGAGAGAGAGAGRGGGGGEQREGRSSLTRQPERRRGGAGRGGARPGPTCPGLGAEPSSAGAPRAREGRPAPGGTRCVSPCAGLPLQGLHPDPPAQARAAPFPPASGPSGSRGAPGAGRLRWLVKMGKKICLWYWSGTERTGRRGRFVPEGPEIRRLSGLNPFIAGTPTLGPQYLRLMKKLRQTGLKDLPRVIYSLQRRKRL
uniref:Myosin heavy chain IB-like n=1 Tax=Phascolarctos cinereus TaxID=38626 RepID=A0A6P5IIS9_PHACI|nr:myosin heavy chain IB-like [Phascolarctos cinereus]